VRGEVGWGKGLEEVCVEGRRARASEERRHTSLELLPKKMYLGRMVMNSMTGPTIAASLEFEKNTLIRKARLTSLMLNRKKYKKSSRTFELGRKDTWAT
jgi:hypothetical protein